MNTSVKILLARLSSWTMVITISFVVIFFVGFIVINTFDLNVFTERTSSFIYWFISLAAVLIICAAFLNISMNIGLIADSRVQHVKEGEKEVSGAKITLFTLGFIVLLVAGLFLGDYWTRQYEKQNLVTEADDLLTRYSASIDKIAAGLTDSNKVADVPEILKFLSNQKVKFPAVQLIVNDQFEGQQTYLILSQNTNVGALKQPHYGNPFYKCDTYDCDYLEQVFAGKADKPKFWTKDNDYKLYYPMSKGNKRFVLLFSRYERYGHSGSF